MKTRPVADNPPAAQSSEEFIKDMWTFHKEYNLAPPTAIHLIHLITDNRKSFDYNKHVNMRI